MNYKLDHIARNCKDLAESAQYYENHFSDQSTPIRKAGDGQNFCFVNISGAAAIQLIETASETGINHYGGKLTTLFVKDYNVLKMEVRLPR